MMRGHALRLLALAEAATLLALLFIAVPLKHFAGIPEASRIMGPIHGLTFLAFSWKVVQAWSEGLVARQDAVRLLIGACLPFGGIINERWLKARLSSDGA